jgi:hypothetical protein
MAAALVVAALAAFGKCRYGAAACFCLMAEASKKTFSVKGAADDVS